VVLVAEKSDPVIASGGMKVIPEHAFHTCPPLDILVVPGGWGTRRELKNTVMLDWLKARAAEVETLTAVCTGSMLLGFAGLLDGLHATTHWKSLDWMRDSFPAVSVHYDQHVVENDRVVTSAGISAGIDMALKVVARYCGEPAARATARHMEYPYPDSNARRV
jgi:transcriptional regulator GlxA family with amidase domain